jgi:hypothetical protein
MRHRWSLGQPDPAMGVLEKRLSTHDGFQTIQNVENPDFTPIREDESEEVESKIDATRFENFM